MGVEEPPPPYDSVFNELAVKKAESSGVVDYTKGVAEVYNKKASGLIGMCMCGIFCSLLGLALPVTEIVIGSLYLHQCSAQRLIPIYLIVAGVFGVATGGSGSARRFATRKRETDPEEAEEEKEGAATKVGGCCSSLTGIFTFVWTICGSVWVFSMNECTSTDGLLANSTDVDCFTKDKAFSDSSFYCQRLLYDFTFYEAIAKWAVVAFMMFIGLIVCCCACCAFCCMAGKMKNEASTEMSSGANNKSYS